MLDVDPVDFSITMDRGDYFDPSFTITDANGNALDVTGASFKLTVKADIDDDISVAIFQLTTGASQFDISGQVGGVIKAIGPETLTQALAGDYVYDLEMILGAKTRTVVNGRLTIRKDVTTPGSAPANPSPPSVPFPGDISVAGNASITGYIRVIGGQIYITDTGTGPNAGKSWKLVVQDGVLDLQGPSTVVPF